MFANCAVQLTNPITFSLVLADRRQCKSIQISMDSIRNCDANINRIDCVFSAQRMLYNVVVAVVVAFFST